MAESNEKQHRRVVQPQVLIMVVVTAFLAGFGGALLFIKPMQSALQKQGQENLRRTDQLEKELAAAQREWAQDHEKLQLFQAQADEAFDKGLRSSRSELVKLQKKTAQTEKELLVRLTKLENRTVQAEELLKQSVQESERLRAKTESLEKEYKEQIRHLKSKITDLENKLSQIQR